MSSSVERSGSFEHVKHRESVESLVEDASPTTMAKKHPWKKDATLHRLKCDQKTHRKLAETPRQMNGAAASSSTPIARGRWREQPLHSPTDSLNEHNGPDSPIIIETESLNNVNDSSGDEIPRSSAKRKSKLPRERDPKGGYDDDKPAPLNNEIEPTDGRENESVSLSDTADGPEGSPSDCSRHSPLTSPSSAGHDETLAHLVRMVESNDFGDNDDHVPFADQESKGSISEYSAVEDKAPVFFQSASSGYFAENEDPYASHGTIFQSATSLSSEGNSPFEFDPQALQSVGGCQDIHYINGDASDAASQNFAIEHRIFMKAALELLSQRERYAADIDMNDKDTIKSGPLKKASHLVRGIWKVKYAEVRRGVFSYYEDESKDSEAGTLVRKNIPLHAATCSCRAVKIEHKALSVNPGGAIFELNVEGGAKRLWMANTREERQAWIEAIHTATLGRSVTRGESDIDHHAGKSGTVSDESPFRVDLELYATAQREISRAASRYEYVRALSKLLGKKLNIPIQWIRREMGGTEQASRAFHEETVSVGVDQLWKDLLRDSVQIDDELFDGGSGNNVPDRIISSLMRCIMVSDRSSPLSVNASETQKNKYYISESQALSFSRDILLAGNRTRSGGDSYYCVNTLCGNPEHVVTVPSSLVAEPWRINISHIQPEKRSRGDTYYSLNELSGWLRTRSKPQKKWKKRYFVLTEGTLSYFEKAMPRPRGLRGQIGVVETAISVNRVPKSDINKRNSSKDTDDSDASNDFLVSIIGKDGKLERQILFEDEKKFILWAHSLEAYCVGVELWQSNHSVSKVGAMFRNLREELIGTQDLYGTFVLGHKSLKENADDLDLDRDEVQAYIANESKSGANGRATVLISVEAATDYKVCTLDPQGDEKDDTWG
jgi:hypothetical protein